MTNDHETAAGIDRRAAILAALGTAALALGDGALWPLAAATSPADTRRIGLLPFVGEAADWLRRSAPGLEEVPERRFGSGLGGRKSFDLATLGPGAKIVSPERFFVRTFAPERLPGARRWTIALAGLVEPPGTVTVAELRRRAGARGVHLMECSGNSGEHDFGLISAASWTGVPIAEVLDRVPAPRAARIEVVGFDEHAMPSLTSRPGASWIFARDELESARAFLATGIDGARLTGDHGAPVRLVVPGWYGCASIKWVREIRWLAPDAPASAQMREFASRTHQEGVPERAADYRSATIDPAAMPVRAELWRRGAGREIRLLGVAWGGPRPVRSWSIRAGEDAAWRPLDRIEPPADVSTWRLWWHRVVDPAAGRLAIRLRVDDEGVRTHRLDRGYYERAVEVPAS